MAFRHNLRFNILFGNSCFTSPVFDPFFCQQFFFRNRFLFAQPALPYPYFYSDYGYDSEEAAQPQVVAVPASAPVQSAARGSSGTVANRTAGRSLCSHDTLPEGLGWWAERA